VYVPLAVGVPDMVIVLVVLLKLEVKPAGRFEMTRLGLEEEIGTGIE
jgi:hypothetical protein